MSHGILFFDFGPLAMKSFLHLQNDYCLNGKQSAILPTRTLSASLCTCESVFLLCVHPFNKSTCMNIFVAQISHNTHHWLNCIVSMQSCLLQKQQPGGSKLVTVMRNLIILVSDINVLCLALKCSHPPFKISASDLPPNFNLTRTTPIIHQRTINPLCNCPILHHRGHSSHCLLCLHIQVS